MKRTSISNALPQQVYNAKYSPDPRQAIDPSMYKVAMRRKWLPRKWKLGSDPWEMDKNEEKDFSKRNLADEYANKVRQCLGFAEATPYYLEMIERGIPVTTTFMNLYLASAQRFRSISDTRGNRKHVWLLYLELTKAGAKPDINTLDLIRNTLHTLCQEYCDELADRIVDIPEAKLTAAVQKALMDVSESSESTQAFFNKFNDTPDSKQIAPIKTADARVVELLNVVAGYCTDRKGLEIYRDFLLEEKERKTVIVSLQKHEAAIDGSGEISNRLDERSISGSEMKERRCDERKGDLLKKLIAMISHENIKHIIKDSETISELTSAEIITGSVPRSTKTGKALTSMQLPTWEAKLLTEEENVASRQTIKDIRLHCISSYNELCTEMIHRQGAAATSQRLDGATVQSLIEATLQRFRSSLKAISMLSIYDADRIAPLRSEIIGEMTLPIELTEYSDHADDVTIGCNIEKDIFLPVNQRTLLSPATARVALSYFAPMSILPPVNNVRSPFRKYNLFEFCRDLDIFERPRRIAVETLYSGQGPAALKAEIDAVNLSRQYLERSTTNSTTVRKELLRRTPAIQQVFTSSVERIIDIGSAASAGSTIANITHIALRHAHLWPCTNLNTALLTVSSTAPIKEDRLIIAEHVKSSVRGFDAVYMALREEYGLVGVSGSHAASESKRNQTTHLHGHPVLSYPDTGYGEEFFSLYLRSKPWELGTPGVSDIDDAFDLFKSEVEYVEKRWEKSVGIPRGQGGSYFDPQKKAVIQIGPRDVPSLAARWEDRFRCLHSVHTVNALLSFLLDTLSTSLSSLGKAKAHEINIYTFQARIEEIRTLMKENSIEATAETYSLLLTLTRRAPYSKADLEAKKFFEGLHQDVLAEMKAGGKQHWWQWFEEV